MLHPRSARRPVFVRGRAVLGLTQGHQGQSERRWGRVSHAPRSSLPLPIPQEPALRVTYHEVSTDVIGVRAGRTPDPPTPPLPPRHPGHFIRAGELRSDQPSSKELLGLAALASASAEWGRTIVVLRCDSATTALALEDRRKYLLNASRRLCLRQCLRLFLIRLFRDRRARPVARPALVLRREKRVVIRCGGGLLASPRALDEHDAAVERRFGAEVREVARAPFGCPGSASVVYHIEEAEDTVAGRESLVVKVMELRADHPWEVVATVSEHRSPLGGEDPEERNRQMCIAEDWPRVQGYQVHEEVLERVVVDRHASNRR
mmetsp:Transcript_108043/g.314276  ORF Transcript_108043/g.314276 Transcript_108043/m.314276 type:complete len:319 (+) Transcript_108043:82-1038(+)